jgi:hypothetical protein
VEIRECTEVSFAPGEKSEHKDTQPLRYIAIRIRQRPGEAFGGGGAVEVQRGECGWPAESPIQAVATPRRPGCRHLPGAIAQPKRRTIAT